MSRSSGFDYGWVVVAAGALMTCVGFGTMLSLAVFLQPMSEASGWSRAGVSARRRWISSAWVLPRSAGARCRDRFGTRIVVLSGAVLLGLGLVAREPGDKPMAIPALLRRARRRRRRQLLCADDRGRQRWFDKTAALRSRWCRPEWAWHR